MFLAIGAIWLALLSMAIGVALERAQLPPNPCVSTTEVIRDERARCETGQEMRVTRGPMDSEVTVECICPMTISAPARAIPAAQ